jgi:hypothetical protein
MVDEGGEKVVGKGATDRPPDVSVPTGSEMTSEGSSVELDAELATAEEIPSTKEVLRRAEEARRKRRAHPAPAEEAPEAEHEVPHDKGRTVEIE